MPETLRRDVLTAQFLARKLLFFDEDRFEAALSQTDSEARSGRTAANDRDLLDLRFAICDLRSPIEFAIFDLRFAIAWLSPIINLRTALKIVIPRKFRTVESRQSKIENRK